MSSILAIDPGSERSGIVVFVARMVAMADVLSNPEILADIRNYRDAPHLLALEQIGHYGTGMPAGKSVFDTCIWIGRFIQCWCERRDRDERSIRLILRPTIKTHLCGSPKAKDANVATAVRDRLGPKGTKRSPGPTHGVTSHAMQALALALYVSDIEKIAAA